MSPQGGESGRCPRSVFAISAVTRCKPVSGSVPIAVRLRKLTRQTCANRRPAALAVAAETAEAALNQYVKASTVWDKCFEDVNCSNDSIEPTLRKYWDKASTSIDTADEGLQGLETGA